MTEFDRIGDQIIKHFTQQPGLGLHMEPRLNQVFQLHGFGPRSSLMASGESAKVESVIRLLEQTYERLRHDTEDEVIETNSVDENYNVVKLMVSLSLIMATK